jgi:hypothetical protein
MTMFTAPADARPNSAVPPLVTAWNSRIISSENDPRDPPRRR